MDKIRYFNREGKELWISWLKKLQEDKSITFPIDLLSNSDYTSLVPGGQTVEKTNFCSKFALAENLAPKIRAILTANFPHDRWPGLWDWLAAYYFDQVCKTAADGAKELRELARYTYTDDFRRYYRHRIFGPVSLYNTHGEYSKIVLSGDTSTISDWEEQMASRKWLNSNPSISKALVKLYWDDKKNAPKVGAAPNKPTPGTLRRFGVLLLQLDRTYDIMSISEESFISLLPKEYNKFLFQK